jgi:3-oxoacyl-[acyl-carrier-protein] synthase-3
MIKVSIAGWGSAAPEQILANAEVGARVDRTDEWIVERTGIRERRIASSEESTATLAVEAGRLAIERAGLAPEQIDLMLIATCTPEQPIPHTGAFVGDALGLRCGSFDLNAACSGFVYGMVAGASMVAGGGIGNVLVIGAETFSRILNYDDRGTCVLFGDGAGAAVLVPSTSDDGGILAWDAGCDGSTAWFVGINAGGSRLPVSPETVAAGEHYLKMVGKEVFNFAVPAIVKSVSATLDQAGVELTDVDWVIPHQANARMVEAAMLELGVPPERVVLNIERYGNTSAASIPLALAEAADDGRFKPGDLVMFPSVGAGMTWATLLFRWS